LDLHIHHIYVAPKMLLENRITLAFFILANGFCLFDLVLTLEAPTSIPNNEGAYIITIRATAHRIPGRISPDRRFTPELVYLFIYAVAI